MNRVLSALAALLCLAGEPWGRAADLPRQDRTSAVSVYGGAPLCFEANKGQTTAEVKFLSRGPGYSLFLTAREAVLVLAGGSPARLKFQGANPMPRIEGLDRQVGVSNYVFAADTAKSIRDVPRYSRVRYTAVYPGVDVVFHGTERQIEYDLVLAPGANPEVISLAFEGGALVNARGDLVVRTPQGELHHHKPLAYQNLNGIRTVIDAGYVRRGKAFGFRLGAYDKSRPLVIDPVLTFSTYLGGHGNETANAVAVDQNGNVYVAGGTTSTDFPTARHIAYCRPTDGPNQAPCRYPFVTKLNPKTSAIVYSTYFVVGDGYVHGIALDGLGNAYVTGNTDTGFDAAKTSSAFVAKLDADGSQLVYYKTISVPVTTNKEPYHSSGEAIMGDAAGNMYVTGNYQSDVFVVKLDPAGNTLWSMALASTTAWDSGTGIALDNAGAVYVAGYAGSDFPTTPVAFQTLCSYGTCGFITKINAQGSGLVYSTFLGDASIKGLAVSRSGNAHVTGSTSSPAFPTANALQPNMGACGTAPCSDAFVTELNATGSGLVFSTYLGGSERDGGQAIALDSQANVYVAGYTASTDFPTVDAVQSALNTSLPVLSGGANAFVSKLNPSGSAFLYSTYLGGDRSDVANALATDAYGNAYVAGTTTSATFPTVRSVQPRLAAANVFVSDTFAARISSSASGGSAILVQSNAAAATAVASLSAAFPSNNTAGNLIVALVRMSTITQVATVSDSAGNAYIDAVSQAQTADGHQIHIFYAANIRGGANTVQAAFSGTNNHPWLAVYEFSGLSATTALDQVGHAQGSSAGPSTAFTTTTSAELVFSAVGLPSSYTGTVGAGAGYTLLRQDAGSARAATEAGALNAAGQYAAGFNLSSAANWSMAVATFFVAPAVIPPPAITTAALRYAVQNVSYGDVLTATNGKIPYRWSVVSGSLPAGLSLNADTGAISGTPTVLGTNNLTVRVTDANLQISSKALSITVNPDAPPPVVTTTALPGGTQGQPYSATLTAGGGIPPYTWSLFIQPDPGGNYGDFPPGLTLDARTGVISGIPTGGGSSLYVQVTDADYHIAVSTLLTIAVNPPGGGAAIPLVQAANGQGLGAGAISAAFSQPNTAGNTIVAFVRMSSTSQTVTISDTLGNVYARAVSQAQTADGHQVHIFYAANIKGGANTVRASFSATNNYSWLAVYEYGGALALDKTAQAQGSGTAVSTAATGTTSSAKELVFAGIGLPASSTALVSPGPDYALLQQNGLGAAGMPHGANESQVVSASGSFSGAFTLSQAANWSAVVATFMPVSTSTIAFVQSAAIEGTAVTSVSVSFPSANTAGNMVLVFVRMSTTTQTVTLSDTAGNVYAAAVSQAQTSDGHQIRIFYASRVKGGPNTVIAQFSGSNSHPWLAVYECSGVTTLDTTAHAQGFGTLASSGASAPASAPNELVFAGLGLPSSSAVSITAGPLWTLALQDTREFGSRASTEQFLSDPSLPGPYAGTFNLSASDNWSAVIAVFKP